MAATNQRKRQHSGPAWAARGKLRLCHVAGGPAETARMLLSGEWDFTPGALLSTSRYAAGLVEELAARKISAVCLDWSAGFSHEGDRPQWECARQLLPLLKKKRIKAIARICLGRCFAAELFRREPQAAAWLERDAAGQPLPLCQGHALRMAPQNPGWRQYVAHKAAAAAEAGFNGLYFENIEGKLAEAAEFIRNLRATVRGLQPLDEDELLFCAQAPLLSPVTEACNLKCTRLPVSPGLQPGGALSCNLPFLKLAFEDGGRDKLFAAGFSGAEFTPKARALATAEILASGGICSDYDSLAEYSLFQAQNPALFGQADAINQAGLLLDEAEGGAGDTGDASRLLARLNLQHDLIPVSQSRHFEFRKYRLLNALHLSAPDKALAEALQTFVRENKGVLLISSQARDRLSLDAADEERTEVAAGGGRIISYRAPTESRWQAENYQRLVITDMLKFCAQTVTVQAVDGVLAQLWGKGTARWVHVLNYGDEPAGATISLPGCGGRKLKVYSPDQRQPELKVLETGSATASFELTGLETYCIVEVA